MRIDVVGATGAPACGDSLRRLRIALPWSWSCVLNDSRHTSATSVTSAAELCLCLPLAGASNSPDSLSCCSIYSNYIYIYTFAPCNVCILYSIYRGLHILQAKSARLSTFPAPPPPPSHPPENLALVYNIYILNYTAMHHNPGLTDPLTAQCYYLTTFAPICHHYIDFFMRFWTITVI